MKLMNSGTKIRTICLAIVLINQANVSLGQVDFGNETVNLIYRIASYLLTLAAAWAAWYYNNDTSEEGAIGTGITRQLKKEQEEGYIGDFMFIEDGENPCNGEDIDIDEDALVEGLNSTDEEDEFIEPLNEKAGEDDE